MAVFRDDAGNRFLAANGVAEDSWLREFPEYEWFLRGIEYAASQTMAIPALATCSPEDLYYTVCAILRGAGLPQPAEIARLTRELEEARERERAHRQWIEAIAVGVRVLAHESEPGPEGAVIVSARNLGELQHGVARALATPQEVSDGTTRWYCEYGCGCVLDSRSARYHDCRTPRGEGVPPPMQWAQATGRDGERYAAGWNACRDAMLAALRSAPSGAEDRATPTDRSETDGE